MEALIDNKTANGATGIRNNRLRRKTAGHVCILLIVLRQLFEHLQGLAHQLLAHELGQLRARRVASVVRKRYSLLMRLVKYTDTLQKSSTIGN